MTCASDSKQAVHRRHLKAVDLPGFRLCETLYSPAQEIPVHRHPEAGLCLVVEGGYQQWRGRSHVRLGPASLVLHPPDEVHVSRISEAGSRCFTVGIAADVFRHAAEDLPGLRQVRGTWSGAPSWVAFRLRADLYHADDVTPTSVESAVMALLADLAARPGLVLDDGAAPWLERVKEQIHEEFARGLTLGVLSRTAGVHPVHVARTFRRHFGCTVGDYIRQRRIEFACARLLASQDSLSDVAFDAGFADQSHLTTTFRRLVGITPGAFRTRFGQA